MERRCACGELLVQPTDALGCIECGRPCCHGCAVSLESVWYCLSCADERLEVPGQ